MTINSMDEMTDEEYADWLKKVGGNIVDLTQPSEENLVKLVSLTLGCSDMNKQAQGFVEIADMCLALADKTLGSQGFATKCLFVTKH